MGEFIDSAWYDEKELETDYDYTDSMGKGYYACSRLHEHKMA